MDFKNSYQTLINLSDDDEFTERLSVSIFKVAESMSRSKPKAYVPQLVGLGPFHHFRPELQQMQTFKLALVKRATRNIPGFGPWARTLARIGVASRARASYSAYLDFDDETLAGIVAVDGLYLFELLRRCVDGAGAAPEFFRDFVDPARRGTRNITVQDAIKLENQIPIQAVKLVLTAVHWEQILAGERRSLGVVTELFPELLLGFAASLSPLKVVIEDYPLYEALRHPHLLDLLYALVALKIPPRSDPEEEEREARLVKQAAKKFGTEISGSDSVHPQVLECQGISAAKEEVIESIADVVLDVILPPGFEEPVELVRGLIGLPWSEIWSCLKDILTGRITEKDRPLIPRASELGGKGITFRAVDRIFDVGFDRDALSFRLLEMRLDRNSEVVLRNLVAYEAAVGAERGSLLLARFVALMSCLAKRAEDVRLLADQAIIETSFSSSSSSLVKEDEIAARLFGGMSEVGRGTGTNTPDLDKAIAEVNCYYDGLWSVVVSKFLRKWGRVFLNFFGVSVFVLLCFGGLGLAFWLLIKWLIKAI